MRWPSRNGPRAEYIEPPVFVNLYLLFAFEFGKYETSLAHLASTIELAVPDRLQPGQIVERVPLEQRDRQDVGGDEWTGAGVERDGSRC